MNPFNFAVIRLHIELCKQLLEKIENKEEIDRSTILEFKRSIKSMEDVKDDQPRYTLRVEE